MQQEAAFCQWHTDQAKVRIRVIVTLREAGDDWRRQRKSDLSSELIRESIDLLVYVAPAMENRHSDVLKTIHIGSGSPERPQA